MDVTITEIVTDGNANAHVQLSCVIQNAPKCATANNYFGFDKSTASGKQWLAMVTMAYVSNSKVAGSIFHDSCAKFQENVTNLEHLRISK